MKSLVLVLTFLATAYISNGQNVVYDENAEVRLVGNFTAVEVSGTVSLYLSQGTSQGVAISAGDEKYNSKIKTEVINGVLRITVDGGLWNGFNWTNRKLKAYVTVTDLQRLEVSGASYVTVTGALKATDLHLHISGASEMKGIINVNKLNLNISGASEAKLSGTANEAIINASGACSLTGYGFNVDTCNISSSGASHTKITVNKQLTADATGASSIYYKGAASSKVLKSRSASDIKHIGQ